MAVDQTQSTTPLPILGPADPEGFVDVLTYADSPAGEPAVLTSAQVSFNDGAGELTVETSLLVFRDAPGGLAVGNLTAAELIELMRSSEPGKTTLEEPRHSAVEVIVDGQRIPADASFGARDQAAVGVASVDGVDVVFSVRACDYPLDSLELVSLPAQDLRNRSGRPAF